MEILKYYSWINIENIEIILLNILKDLCKDYRQSWNITLGTHEEWVRAIGPKRNIQGNIWIAEKYTLHSTKEKSSRFKCFGCCQKEVFNDEIQQKILLKEGIL